MSEMCHYLGRACVYVCVYVLVCEDVYVLENKNMCVGVWLESLQFFSQISTGP